MTPPFPLYPTTESRQDMQTTISAETAMVVHQAGTGLVNAADAATTNLENWLVAQALHAADPSMFGDRQAADPLAEIADAGGLQGAPDGRHPGEIAQFLLGVQHRLSSPDRFVLDAYEGWNTVFCYTEQVVGALGVGNIRVSYPSGSWTSGGPIELSADDAQKVSDAARQLGRLAVDAHQVLDRFVKQVAAGVDDQVEQEWSAPARQCFGALCQVLDTNVPSVAAARLDACAEWCWELWTGLPNEYRTSIQAAAEAIDNLASNRSRAEHTCIDLAAMCGRS